jgi:hypothetical protein
MTPADVKLRTLRCAIDAAPSLRDGVVDTLTEVDKDTPRVLGELVVAGLGSQIFGSRWLASELQDLARELAESDDAEAAVKFLPIIGGLQKGSQEASAIQAVVDQALGVIGGLEGNPSDQARLLIGLMIATNELPEISKSLDKRLRRLLRRHPGLSGSILPRSNRRGGVRIPSRTEPSQVEIPSSPERSQRRADADRAYSAS